ncbi:MAG: hypothetical protein IH586_22805, partial [Anaerolineaceae bacterium]|nr:hypothetical protein [Anaerolineaceae bacterium]
MSIRRIPWLLSSFRCPPWLVNLSLTGLWLWLYRAVFPYLWVIFSREEFRTNQIVLVGVAALVIAHGRKSGSGSPFRLHINVMPQFSWPALALALGGSVLFLLVERFLDINTISAALFGLASYGLLGLWQQPRRWRKGLLAALLL